jgi:outer membrane protein OmpA-like peptidoglycan-associated protein
MAAGCKKCDPHEICEECPEWIFTLADLIMCMMGLFVILWVLKPGPTDKRSMDMNPEWVEVAAAVREAFGHVPDPQSNDPIDLQMLLKKLERMKINGPGDGGKTKLPRRGAEGTDPEVTSIRQGKQATVGGKLIFTPGQAALGADLIPVLDEIVALIRGHRNVALVKGHTSLDDFADANASAEEKMSLSVRRAQAVADYLTSHGVEPDILRVQGCSTFEPVIQRTYGPDAQRANRRVEIEVTATLVGELQDRAQADDGVRMITAIPKALASPANAPNESRPTGSH